MLDQAAQSRIVLNLGLAHYFVRRCITPNDEFFDDFLQEASIGLINAAGRFDPKQGTCFSSYAARCILCRIARARERFENWPGESLDTPLPDAEHTLSDLVSDPRPPSDEVASRGETRRWIRQAVDMLPERECTILELRYGFRGREYALAEIGIQMNLSRERIRQIEARALQRLSELLTPHLLKHTKKKSPGHISQGHKQ